MKVTRRELAQLIKEELDALLSVEALREDEIDERVEGPLNGTPEMVDQWQKEAEVEAGQRDPKSMKRTIGHGMQEVIRKRQNAVEKAVKEALQKKQ